MKFVQQHYIDFAHVIYTQNCKMGWWNAPVRSLAATLDLIHSELSEGTEGDRKNLMDDKLPMYPNTHVEIADALIRTLDCLAHYTYLGLCPKGHFSLRFVTNTSFSEMNMTARHFISRVWHYRLVDCAYELNEVNEHMADELWKLVHCLHEMSNVMEFDLLAVMRDKVAFNAVRPDHQLENRESDPHGKKY